MNVNGEDKAEEEQRGEAEAAHGDWAEGAAPWVDREKWLVRGRELAARRAKKDTQDRRTERQMDPELVRPHRLKHGHGDRKTVAEVWIEARAGGEQPFLGSPGNALSTRSGVPPTELKPW